MSGPVAAPCDNCGAEAPARYCPECGQETRWTPRRPAFRIAAEAVEEAFALDSRIGRTAAPFLARPGLLTAEYWAGRRVRYSSPLRLYLLTSFLFFLAGAARPMLQARTPPAAPEQASPEEQAEMGREAEALRRWFHLRDGRWVVDDAIRRSVRFFHANLLEERALAAAGRVDALFCRNVMIYFDVAARRRVLHRFHEKLRGGGYLLLGHSESLLNVTADFELAHLRNDLVYRKPRPGDGEGEA